MGIWKDFDELESSISLQELMAILEAKHEKEREDKIFAAALKGVKLDNNDQERFEAVRARAAARLKGVPTDKVELADVGIGFQDE